MNFKVQSTPNFEREAKKLLGKYRSLKVELATLIDELATNPTQGTPLGNHVFKIRMAVASKGKGKSGGARVITCVKIINEIVYLVSIYDKSQKDSVTKKEIEKWMKIIE